MGGGGREYGGGGTPNGMEAIMGGGGKFRCGDTGYVSYHDLTLGHEARASTHYAGHENISSSFPQMSLRGMKQECLPHCPHQSSYSGAVPPHQSFILSLLETDDLGTCLSCETLR